MAEDARQAELRGLLAEALPEDLGPVGLRRRAVPQLGIDAEVTGYGDVLLDRLLPVVEFYAAQKAAEELRAAARTADVWTAGRLRDRAAALTPASEEKR